MDEDMSFPNPVERNDLPVKKARWPKILGVLLVLGFLFVALLPQFLHTRIGRRFIRAKLESKFAGEIVLEDFHTSWFGGTTASQFWLRGVDGRTVGCSSFKSDKLSLWKLLRGKYDLGHCTIDGLILDYTFDVGDAGHGDSYEKLTGALPRTATTPPTALSKLSGQITLTHAQVTLYRNELDPTRLVAVGHPVKFANLSGTFDIPTLDGPWKFNLTGENNLAIAGTVSLGRGGLLLGDAVAADVTASTDGIPTDICAVLLPQVNVADCRSALGDSFNHAEVAVKGSGGNLNVSIEASSQDARINLSPVFDVKPFPARVTLESTAANTIRCNLPRGYAGTQLALANPILADAIDGKLTLHITSLDGPFARTWITGNATATLEARNVKIASRHGSISDQVAGIVGSMPSSIAEVAQSLALSNGIVSTKPATFPFADAQITLAGGANVVSGKLNFGLTISNAAITTALAAPLTIPLTGTATHPSLETDSIADAKLRNWLSQQAAAFHEKQERAEQKEVDKEIQKEFIKPLEAGTQP